MKKILFIGGEALPFASTGGLGDVLGSLPAALAKAGGEEIDVRVVMPLYKQVSEEWRAKMEDVTNYVLPLSWRKQYVGVKKLEKDGVTWYFIDSEFYFARPRLYGEYDDGERFAFFSLAAIDMLGVIGFYPDIIHAHDWQAAMSVVYLNQKYRQIRGYENIRTVFTIHNIEYQGKYDPYILGDVFGLSNDNLGLMSYDGCLNLMKAAIMCADRVTTVSPTYAQEIQYGEFSHGLDRVLRPNAGKVCGILNGIDYNYYNPSSDKELAQNYTWRSTGRKAACKKALQKEMGLPERDDVPMIAIISRLVSHKGLDIVTQMLENLVSNRDIQLVVLGTGDASYEGYFRHMEWAHYDKVRGIIKFDRALSKRIYSACDIFLMPSLSEPCGLSQMIASRYGAIPVVRETGGLFDSIKPFWMDGDQMMGNGFTFAHYNPDELAERINAAIDLWLNKDLRDAFVKKIMRTDFSWEVSAQKYLELYAGIC